MKMIHPSCKQSENRKDPLVLYKGDYKKKYRLFVLIGLVFTYLGSLFSGFFGIEKPANVKTVAVNGSLSAVDALGRVTVSAGGNRQKGGCVLLSLER